jgi:hypothetical protein
VAAQGPAKDCNLRAIFIDRITVNGPDGKPMGKGSNRLVYLAAPVKEPGGANVQLIIGGLTEDPADAPGPFGNYLPAATPRCNALHGCHGGGPDRYTGLTFAAVSGEKLELHLKRARRRQQGQS